MLVLLHNTILDMYRYFTLPIPHYYTSYMSLVKVTCLVWRSFQCFWSSRIKLSHMLPLPSLSFRMPCHFAFVPVGNAYTTLCSNVLSTNLLIQIIIAILSGMGCFCLHSAFLCSTAFVVKGNLSHTSSFMVE